MSRHGVLGAFVALILATACGGRAVIDGDDNSATVAGGSSAGGMRGSAGSATAGAGNAGASATSAGGAVLGSGGAADASGGTDSGITVECPPPDSSLSAYSALDGKGCANVGDFCSAGYVTIDCFCQATSVASHWRCVKGHGGPPK